MCKAPLLPAVGALLVSVGCSGGRAEEEPRQGLLNTLEARQRAVAQGDVKRLLSYWTDDVVIYPVSEPAVRGITAVGNYVRRHRQELGLRPRITPVEVVASQSADLGYIVGTYEWVDREGDLIRPGRYVALWRTNEQGDWRCFLEIHSPRPVEDAEMADTP